MKAGIFNILLTLVFATGYSEELRAQSGDPRSGLDIIYEDDKFKFKEEEKQLIDSIIVQSEKEIRTLLPSLPNDIKVIVTIIDRNIDVVGGISGRADAHTPGELLIEVSNEFPDGIAAAVKTSLSSALYHELHHISRGWTIRDNKFGAGIPIAAVNEGLAVVFSELYTGVIHEGNSYPKDVDKWAEEIMALPKDASYYQWVMGEHPDGRTSIGYRTGNYIIRQAIANSGKNILELSKLTPDEILNLAGY